MDVFISIDMEGVAGVATREQCRRGQDDYPMGRQLMTGEANAAIVGAFDGGATRVVVRDAHGDMANLLPEELDRRAVLVHGTPSAYSMLEGIDRHPYAVALFVGYHAGAGVDTAVLAHTYSGASFHDVRVNGHSMTEAELNALLAGVHEVPVGLVTGDDRICAVVEDRLPGTHTLAVKEGRGFTVSASMHPAAAREAITEAAAAATKGAAELAPTVEDGPFTLEVELTDLRRADLCALPPGVERDGRTVRYRSEHYLDVFHCLRTWLYLAAAVS